MTRRSSVLSSLLFVAVLAAPLHAQTPAVPAAPAVPPRPPATKLEAFAPAAGTILTVGYDKLGSVSGVTVQAREMVDGRGTRVRGLVVNVYESQFREERSFLDVDEIAELLTAMDALMAVAKNPTSFQQYEVRYKTKGDLEVIAFNNSYGQLSFNVRAGRLVPAGTEISLKDFTKLRGFLAAGSAKLEGLPKN